jgi:DNA (cytosine-5)-methyltransferase 1
MGAQMALSLDSRTPPPIQDGPRTLRSIELFTGAGGLALGTHAAGFRHAFLVERDEHACKTIRANARAEAMPGIASWVDNLRQRDIREVDFTVFKGLDLCAGGAPCQPFSIGGKHRGMEDPRDMIPQFVRAVRESTPRAFLLENVRGLLREAFFPYLEYVLLQLRFPSDERHKSEDWGRHRARLEARKVRGDVEYHVTYALLNAADFGVPQIRWRVLVVGTRAASDRPFTFPAKSHSHDALLVDQWVTGEYWERHELPRPAVPERVVSRVGRLSTWNLEGARPWRTLRDAIGHLPEPLMEGYPQWPDHRLQRGARSYHGHSGSELDMPSKTLKSGVHGVPGGENMLRRGDGSIRYYSVHETALIQTFPDKWTFAGPWGETMRQLGNAVPVHLAEVVSTRIADQLGRV